MNQTTSKIIRGIFSLSVGSFVRLVTGFLVTVFGARRIPENDMGVYFLLLALVALLEMIGNMGLRLSASKFIAGATSLEEQSEIVNNILTIRLITLVVVSLLAWIGKPLFLLIFPSELLSRLYYVVPILFVLQLTESTLAYIMQGFQLYRKMAVVEIILGFANLSLALFLLIVVNIGLMGLVLTLLISLAMGIIIRYIMIPTKKQLSFDRQVVKKIINFGFTLQGNDVLSYIISQVDTLLVALLLNPASLAYLEIARKIPLSLQKVAISINSVYFPHLTQMIGQGDKEEAEHLLNNFLRIVAAGTLLAAFECIIFQEEIIRIIFSEKYLVSAPAFGLYMLIFAISMVSQILDTSYISAGYPVYVLVVNFVVAFFVLGGNLFLIPMYGFMGSVFALLLAETVGNSASFWAVRRSGLNAELKTYLYPFLVMIVFTAVYYLVGWNALFFKLILAALLPLLFFVFAFITFSDFRNAADSLRSSRQESV